MIFKTVIVEEKRNQGTFGQVGIYSQGQGQQPQINNYLVGEGDSGKTDGTGFFVKNRLVVPGDSAG
jgi:hypothetical protein